MYSLFQQKKDLVSIANYTAEKWGKKQALRYADLLDAGFSKISNSTDFSKHIFNDRPLVRVCKCEHHYIFYLNGKEKRVILAVLHERMDLMERLKGRLPKEGR